MEGDTVSSTDTKSSKEDVCALVTVKIKCVSAASSDEVPKEIVVSSKGTIYDIKMKMKEHANVPVEEIYLVFAGNVLESAHYIEHYKIKDQDTLIYYRKKQRNRMSPVDSNATANSNSANSNSSSSSSNWLPGNGGMGNPMEMMNNPEFMQRMMDSPIMQSMLDNPEIIRSMLQSNPQMQALLESNPQLNHVLNDPQLLRQQMEAIRNPAVMQEMLRNQDRAMANIESLPGGYNALRRMYHDVQEPMMEAAEEAAQRRAGMISDDNNTEETNYVTPGSAPNSETVESPWGSSNTLNSNPSMPNNPMAGLFGQMNGSRAGGTANSNPFASLLGQNRNVTSNSNIFPGLFEAPNPNSNNNTPNPWASNNVSDSSSDTTNSNPWARNNNASAAQNNEGTNTNPVQFLQNSFINQQIRQQLSDPSFLQNLENSDPLLGGMLRSNPQLREMLTNPELINQMLSPENLQALNNLNGQQLPSFPGFGIGNATGNMIAGASSGANAGAEANTSTNPLASLLGSLPTIPPEQRFSRQLTQLEAMGFTNRADNIQALTVTNGNVDSAIDRLLGGNQ
mmetsp:Transcript_10775/g.14040  ORF Transcript_10775/g.14040 Transcript_10775/m.14040 type:complete len:566 (-) Transcript_10775:964-2661(-)